MAVNRAGSSKLISNINGVPITPSKAIVGANAFAHESGIHQHGILAKRETYEVIDPAEVGWGETELPLTKHSGRAAVKARLEKLGYNLSDTEITHVFERFKKVGDSKKFVYDDDLASLVNDSLDTCDGTWKMVDIQFVAGSAARPTATVQLEKDGKMYTDCAIGNGPVNACFKGSPIMEAHSSSVRGSNPNEAMVSCMVFTIRPRVSASVPSKSSMISFMALFLAKINISLKLIQLIPKSLYICKLNLKL